MLDESAVGAAIRRARQRKRLTQQQLADALDVNRTTVGDWETGTHYPQRNLGALEEVLGITLPPQPDEVPA